MHQPFNTHRVSIECYVCYKKTTQFINLPCNHAYCKTCVKKLKRCAVCKGDLTQPNFSLNPLFILSHLGFGF